MKDEKLLMQQLVLERYIDREITRKHAAACLGLSERSISRYVKRYNSGFFPMFGLVRATKLQKTSELIYEYLNSCPSMSLRKFYAIKEKSTPNMPSYATLCRFLKKHLEKKR